MSEQKIDLLRSLKKQIENLPHQDSGKLDGLRQRTHMLIDKIFGEESKYHLTLKLISFNPRLAFGGHGSGLYDNAWKKGHQSFLNLVDTMIEDISLSIEMEKGNDVAIKETENVIQTDKIFVVHGHNEEMKQSVA